MLEKMFKLKENRTDIRTEVMAGVTSFMTMAYILAVNPSILSACGMDAGGVLVATALASFIGTMCMALLANYPFALAPGMGLNAYFAYTVCLQYGYDWRVALAAVAVEGVIFIVLSLTNVREALFNSIPLSLKQGVSAGIGLFIAFIGLQNAELCVDSSATLVTYQAFAANIHTSGICAILALVGVLIIAIMYLKHIRGAILYGIFISWILGILCQLMGIYVPDVEAGYYSLIPSFSGWEIGNLGAIFGQVFRADFTGIDILEFVAITFSFLFVDIFDTLGTLIGVASKSDMLDEDGRLPRIKPALLADAIATTAGAILGTSTTTTFVESASGVSEGGRTGLTAATTAILFLLAIVLSPIFVAIPSYATAPALIFVGFLMISSVLKIPFDDLGQAVPAYLCMIAMPLFYSISEGLSIGIISYVIINLCGGNRKKVSPLMMVLAVIFVCKYIFL